MIRANAFEYVDVFLDRPMLDQVIQAWRLPAEPIVALHHAYVDDVLAIEQQAGTRMKKMDVESRKERWLRFEREYNAAQTLEE